MGTKARADIIRLNTEKMMGGTTKTTVSNTPVRTGTKARADIIRQNTKKTYSAAPVATQTAPKTKFKDNVAAIGHDIYTAVSGVSDGIWGFADWLTPDDAVADILGVENKVGKFFDDMHTVHANTVEKNRVLGEKANPTVAAIGDYVVQPLVAALPNAALAFASGGSTTAAQAASMASGAAKAGTAARVASSVADMLKTPTFWTSFMQTAGNTYMDAEKSGASELEAQAATLLNGFLGASVEMGGGIEKLPSTQMGMRQWLTNTLEEGGEEVVQGVLEQLTAKALYEQDKEWFSLTDTDAVVSPNRMAQEFGGGLVVGGIMGGGQIAVNKAVNSIRLYSAANQLGNQFLQGEKGHTIDEALQIGLSNAKGTDAYAAALKLQERVNNRQEVSPYAVGRMVMESQSDAAVQAKAIEQMALQSAAQGRFPTDAAENIAAAAVKLNQPVMFGNAAQFQGGQAAYYDHNSQMVVLNPSANEQALQGAVLAHEMVHSAQATQQWTTLENTVRQMMGDAGWQTYLQETASRYAARGEQLDDTQMRQEAVAHWVGDNLFKQGFAQAVAKGDAKTGGLLLRGLDKLRRAVGIKNSPSARDIAMLERLVMQAMENRTGTRSGDGVQYAIVVKADGKIYVQADRKVLTGTDAVAWKTQIDTFFDNVLLQNGSLTVESVEGDELTITKDETVWKGKDEHLQIGGKKTKLTKGQYFTKLVALSHIDELAEASVVQRNKDGSRKVEPDKKNHPFARDGFEYYTVYFQDFDGKYYRVTLSVGLADGVSTVYNVGQMKEATVPGGDIISVIGSKALGTIATDNRVTQTDSVVNTHSMQNGGGNTQSAYLPEDQFVDRMGADGQPPSRGDAATAPSPGSGPPLSAGADISPAMRGNLPFTQGGHAADAATVQVDEGAVLERAVGSQVQRRQVDVSHLRVTNRKGESHYDADAAIDTIAAQIGEEELLRRMYDATQMDRPTGNVTINGQTVPAMAYVDAYEADLPDDPAALREHIRSLEEQRTAAILQMERDGTLEDYTRGGLKIDLQLFAANRKWELLQLDPGEEGKKARQFFEKRLRGTDANHHDELIELLAGRSETYNPISTQKQLDRANNRLMEQKYQQKLIKRIGRYNPRDMFTPVDVAAAQLLINKALNEGEYEVAANLIAGLSRKGTELGRAVQAFSIMARLTPEGTLRMAQRTMKAEADYIIGEGASEGLDVLADDIADAIGAAEENARQNPPAPAGHPPLGKGGYDARPYGVAVEEPLTPARIQEIQQVTDGIRTSFYDLTDEQVAKLEPLENRLYRELKNKSPFIRRRFGEWRIRDNTPVQIATHAGMSRGVQKNTDTGWDIQVSGKVFNESKTHLSTAVINAQPYMPYINDIVKNAVLLDTHTLSDSKSGNSLCMHSLYALADIGDGPQLLKLYVEEMYNPGQKNTARRAYQLLNIENQSAGVQGSQQNAASPITLPTGTVSVADLIRIVKEKDSSYHPKAPEAALVDDLAATEGNYLSRDAIAGIVERAIDQASNVPEQVKRYVLKKIRKNDGGLAQRLYEMHQKGHLTADKTRRAMEAALELPTLSAEDIQTVVEMGTRIQQMQDDPIAQADAMDDLYDFLAAKMSVNGWDKLQAWRKFGMLANVKTHARNLFSNGAYAITRKADDAVAMAIERIFNVAPEKRGAMLGWSHTEHGQSILPALQEKAKIAALEMQKRGAKYETGAGQLKQRRKFFGESKVGEALNAANRWNSEKLEQEDLIFFKPAYIDALGQMMTARGTTEITNEMHEKAMQRALEATFRADNAMSEVVGSLKRFQNSDKAGLRLFGNAVDIIIPFHKTPANIAYQTVMHSPIGIVKGCFELYNATKGKGTVEVADAINSFAKGITGTALLAIGLLLGKAGLFNTGFGKTEKERAADELAGRQENALMIGDLSISLDWLQPAASPLIVGASIGKRLADDDISLSAVFGAVMDGTDSLFEMTMLQSLYDILGGYDAGATATAASVVENAVSQSIPTLLGQAARAIDPVQRKTTGDSDFETLLNQVLAKIPGLTYLLDPELDVWGNEVYRTGKPGAGTGVLNFVQQFALPSNVKVGTGSGDRVSAEILRLYDKHKSRAIPTAVSRDDARDGELDYVEINRLLGQVNRQAVEDFINNDWPYAVQVDAGNGKTKKVTKYYRNMTDEERVRVLQRIYTNTKKTVTKSDEEKDSTDSYFEEIFRRLQQ